MLDRIAGFKQYLSITERDRLDRMQAPEDTLQLFDRFLPYAIALEVENRWADRYTGLLAAAAARQAQAGLCVVFRLVQPVDDTGGFVDSIGSSLASTVSSASTAPGSSSGSGGGGSSGGGGGGGGGGGWYRGLGDFCPPAKNGDRFTPCRDRQVRGRSQASRRASSMGCCRC